MGGKGNRYGNAAVETFLKTVTAELIWGKSWETHWQAETANFQYFNGFHKPRRRYSTSGRKSPVTL